MSLHAEKNYPWSSRVASDLDVGVDDGARDDEYLDRLDKALRELTDLVEPAMEGADPSLPLLVQWQAGVDALESDRLGRLAVSREGLRARNAVMLDWLESLPVDHRLVVSMGGGYSTPIERSVECHVDVFAQVAARYERRA